MQLAIMHAAGDGFWAYMPTKYFLSYLELNSGDFPLFFGNFSSNSRSQDSFS